MELRAPIPFPDLPPLALQLSYTTPAPELQYTPPLSNFANPRSLPAPPSPPFNFLTPHTN
jgi:hypothetical protein